MAKLTGALVPVTEITSELKEQMLLLLNRYFDYIERENFERDLAEKDYVILLTEDERAELKGFSTFQLLDFVHQGESIKVIFSGDTIIDQAYWGTMELPKVWLKAMFSFREAESHKKWYWFLICSGYKTYRFLPVFFRTFYPSCNTLTPPQMEELIQLLANSKFPGDYQPETGTLRFRHSRERLKKGVADVTDEKWKNPHIRFFLEKNPTHAEGTELCCLCEVTESNITPASRKLLGM